MKPLPCLILLLPLLSGCGGGSGLPQTEGAAECRQVALRDPEVRATIAATNRGTTNNVFDKSLQDPHELAREATRQATLDCMRKRGFAGPGGVEPVRNYPFGPLGF